MGGHGGARGLDGPERQAQALAFPAEEIVHRHLVVAEAGRERGRDLGVEGIRAFVNVRSVSIR